MNKALILKYKTEFDYWLNGGNVQAYYIKDSEPKWWSDKESTNYDGNDNFSHIISESYSPDDVLIVIDDEYVELRKALAEGKTVEFKHPQVGYKDWEIVTQEHIFQSVVLGREYRIKPEEPKFKVGDWVRDGKTIYQFIEPSSTYSYKLSLDRCELWQPQLGEWCWFYTSRSYDTPCLRKFITIINDTYIALNSQNSKHITPTEVPSFKKGISDSYVTYKNCEPFIGQLPSYLKE